MPKNVCVCCLFPIESEQAVTQISRDVYHSECWEKINNLRNNKISNELEDISDCLIIDTSDNNILTLNNYEFNKIGKYIDLTPDEKILNEYNNKKFNLIEKIIDGPDYATDIAGNIVPIDKPYLIKYELGKSSKINKF